MPGSPAASVFILRRWVVEAGFYFVASGVLLQFAPLRYVVGSPWLLVLPELPHQTARPPRTTC